MTQSPETNKTYRTYKTYGSRDRLPLSRDPVSASDRSDMSDKSDCRARGIGPAQSAPPACSPAARHIARSAGREPGSTDKYGWVRISTENCCRLAADIGDSNRFGRHG